MNEAALNVSGLRVGTRRSDEIEILKGVSFSIAPGETHCLVGESGSGKSVTSLVTMGLLPERDLRVLSGSVHVAGENVVGASPRRMRKMRGSVLSMIFQEPMTALNPVMTIGRQVTEVYKAHSRMTSAQRRAAALDMLEAVQLPDPKAIFGRYPHQISGGQRQRVMMSIALALKPKLLIADEPTTALDVTTQKNILSLIQELQRRYGTAVLFITHDMGIVADIADRVSVMRGGEIVESGPKEEVLRYPKTEYTRRLLYSVPSLKPAKKIITSSNTPILSINNLSKHYVQESGILLRFLGRGASTPAAEGVSFELLQSQTLGIVGESGSGKSTIARCIVGLETPTSGAIKLHSSPRQADSRFRTNFNPQKQVQFIFQDPFRSLNPRRTIRQSLLEGPLNRGETSQSALNRAREILSLVELPSDSMGKYPHQFSGGQRQRIAIARALLMEPDVIIADEAVSALDVTVQKQVLELFSRIQMERKTAIIFITHDLRVAAEVCDEIIVMQKGHIVEAGRASDVLVAPKAAYTQCLVDAAPGQHWDFQGVGARDE